MKKNLASFYSEIDQIKNKIVNEAYIGIIIMTIPMIISMYLGMNVGMPLTTTIFATLILGYLMFMYLFRNNVSYKLRIWSLILLSMYFSVDSFIQWGLMGLGGMFLFVTISLVALHFSHRLTIIFYFTSIGIYAIMGTLISNQLINYTIDVEPFFYNNAIWTIHICGFALLLSIIVRSILRLNNFMTEHIMTMHQQYDQISMINEQMMVTEVELTERYNQLVEKEATISHMAFYDQSTDLPNRFAFQRRVNELIADSPDSITFSIFYIDIDDFKKINNQLGHATGDKILANVTSRLLTTLPHVDMIARMGGDEFAIIIFSTHPHTLKRTYELVQSSFKRSYMSHGIIHDIHCSVGITQYPIDGSTYETLLKNADTALFEAKSQGKNRYLPYNLQMKASVEERNHLESLLEDALTNGELHANYQPKYASTTGKIVSFEALARWNSSTFGFVSPIIFIPILEASGLIIPFGKNILQEALAQLKYWHGLGFDALTMAVNVSPLQLDQEDFLEDLISIIKEVDIEPKFLEIEITENVFIHNFDKVCKTLQSISDYGIAIALDDFGTGFSSLTYLRSLPINTLKIDKSFVDVINSPDQEEVILSSIIDLAHNLDLKVVAEGIEDVQQKIFLEVNQCDYLQGYYFCKPNTAEAIEIVLLQNNATIKVLQDK